MKPTIVLHSIGCKTTLFVDLTTPTWASHKALKAFLSPSGKGLLLFSVDTAFKRHIMFVPIMTGTILLQYVNGKTNIGTLKKSPSMKGTLISTLTNLCEVKSDLLQS